MANNEHEGNEDNHLGCMPTIFIYIYSFQFLVSIILNSTVIYLATRRKEDYLRNYRMLLCHTALVCVRASLTFWFSQMVIHLRPRAAIITTKGPLLLFFGHSDFALSLFRIIFSDYPGLICVMAYSYSLAVLYRYLAVLHPKILLRVFAPKRTLLLLSLVYVLEVSIAVLGWTGVTRHQKALEDYFPIGNGHVDYESLYIGTFFAESPSYIIACSISGTISAASIIFVFYCSAKVKEQLKKKESVLYLRTLNAHRRLVFALRMQAVLPIMFIVPQFVITVLTMLTTTPPLLEYFAFSLIGWFPVLDPLITIYFVKPFRRTLLQSLCKIKSKGKARTKLLSRSLRLKGDTYSTSQTRNL